MDADTLSRLLDVADRVGRRVFYKLGHLAPWMDLDDWRQEARLALWEGVTQDPTLAEADRSLLFWRIRYMMRGGLLPKIFTRKRGLAARLEVRAGDVILEMTEGSVSAEGVHQFEVNHDLSTLTADALPEERRLLRATLREDYVGRDARTMTPEETDIRRRFLYRKQQQLAGKPILARSLVNRGRTPGYRYDRCRAGHLLTEQTVYFYTRRTRQGAAHTQRVCKVCKLAAVQRARKSEATA